MGGKCEMEEGVVGASGLGPTWSSHQLTFATLQRRQKELMMKCEKGT